ncbi:MAG: Fe-S cluster assembly protein SufD [Longimicrobiales bacterium]|nr:Fe-S cluster assembly protein SufD [Longimicrobiales bacterium]
MSEGIVTGERGLVELDRAEVAARAERDPEWLRERRLHAADVYQRTPMPTTRLEEWRYTDLRDKLDLEALEPGRPAEVADDPAAWPAGLRAAMDDDREASAHIVLIDGAVVHTDLDPALAAKGVVVESLARAVHDDDMWEDSREYLATQAVSPERGKFAALNAALFLDGVFVRVPRGVHVDLPIRVTRWVSTPGVAHLDRVLVLASEASQVTVVDEVLSDDLASHTFVSNVAEVIARDGAQVHFVQVQRLGRNAFNHTEHRTLVHRDATSDSLHVSLGATTSRLDLNTQMIGPGSRAELLGLYFGDGDQHFDHNTSQDHVAPNAFSDLLFKGALDERARAVFRGIIRVHPKAQQTDAYQTNRNLLLSEDAAANTLPNLEIEADDVKCSHGATVGQLDEDSLFYLMSRGIPEARAERLVVLGFLGEVLSRLSLGGVIEKVTREIERKLENH